ncbi:MAG: hypothetical protein EXX96DRAFT_543547 [Benjaminiella poitrasii]|nr:MAG: hypothetical protein EXX96DRAFT_543547 [Benjaminiella poitrasii]
MDEQTQEEIKYKQKFEIEERILAALSKEEDIILFNKLRTTNSDNITTRLPTSKQREEIWQTQANSFLEKIFGIKINSTNMNTKTDFEPQSGDSGKENMQQMVELLAETLNRLINLKNNNNEKEIHKDIDLVAKPGKYDGSMDPFIIDNWVSNINNYKSFRGWDNEQTGKFAITLLTGTANIWYQNLTMQDNAPTDWLSLKREIQAYFKPENAGLRSNDAKIHIKDAINMDDPSLSDAIKVAYRYEGNRQEYVSSSSHRNNISGPRNNHEDRFLVDDPMDLSVVERRELYNLLMEMRQGNFERNNSCTNYINRNTNRHNGRNSYSRPHRRTNQSNNSRRYGPNNTRCYNCNELGHIARECSFNSNRNYSRNNQPRRRNYNINYLETSDDNLTEEHNDSLLHQNNNNDLLIKQSTSSTPYINESSLFYSVMPSSMCFKGPLQVNSKLLKGDVKFLNNADGLNTKLPIFEASLNNRLCMVLIDSGASANYVSRSWLPYASSTRTIQDQFVETANGQQTTISTVAKFNITMKDYNDTIEAYVFDTKFDLILGHGWLSQVQPVPDFFSHTWKIPVDRHRNRFTLICPVNDAQIHCSSNHVDKIELHKSNTLIDSTPTDTNTNEEDYEFLLSRNSE